MTLSPHKAICEFIPPFMKFLRDGFSDLNISPARFQILQALTLSSDITMVELAKRLSVTKRNITTLVDGLEKDGLATRIPHPTDRRSTLVQLTATGHELFEMAAKIQRKHLEKLIDSLDKAQQQELARSLTQLTKQMTSKKLAP